MGEDNISEETLCLSGDNASQKDMDLSEFEVEDYDRKVSESCPAAGKNTDYPLVQAPHKPDLEKNNPVELVNEEKFVWPWKGILVNLPIQCKDGKYVGTSASKLREKYSQFNPVKVYDIYSKGSYTGTAIVNFRKDWSGFKDALNFDSSFDTNHHGKMQWHARKQQVTGPFGWLARADDYESLCPIGNYLRKVGNLKTVSELEQEERQKAGKWVANLTNQIDIKKKTMEDLESKYMETKEALNRKMAEIDMLNQSYNDEMWKLQDMESSHFNEVCSQNKKLRLELESRKQELELKNEELQKREAHNESERKKLDEEKTKNSALSCSLQMATVEQQKADKKFFRLVEEQKRTKEELLDATIKLEKKLDAKQKLELDIVGLKGKMEVMKHMEGIDGSVVQKEMEELMKELEEKETEMEDMKDLHQTLKSRQWDNSNLLMDACNELIEGLRESEGQRALSKSKSVIGVKRIGELDPKPFHITCKRKFLAEESENVAVELLSLWQGYLNNPEWHPFKTVAIEGDPEGKVILNEDDDRLKELKENWGAEVYNAVTRGLMELSEHNPVDRRCILELWNFRENRKARLKEVIN